MKFGAALIVLGLLMIGVAQAHDSPITCTAPTTNTDGTPIVGPLSYNLYAGITQSKKIAQSGTCRFLDPSNTPGVHQYSVSVTNSSGVESEQTGPVTLTLAEAPACGASPPPETQTQICPAPTIGNWQQTRSYVSAPAPTCWTAGEWQPATPPAGVCASPALITAGPLGYERTSTGTMRAIGAVPAGIPCGPAVQLVANIKYCQITRAQMDLFNAPTDLKMQSLWSRAQ